MQNPNNDCSGDVISKNEESRESKGGDIVGRESSDVAVEASVVEVGDVELSEVEAVTVENTENREDFADKGSVPIAVVVEPRRFRPGIHFISTNFYYFNVQKI